MAGVRRYNLAAVARWVAGHPGTSRPELVKNLGLSRPTVYSLVNRLLELGILEERGTNHGRAGRPSNRLWMGGNRYAAIVAEVNWDETTIGVYDLTGRSLRIESLRMKADAKASEIVQELLTGLARAVDELVQLGLTPAGITLAIPGVVTGDGSSVANAPYLKMQDVPIVAQVSEEFGLPSELIHLDRLSNLSAKAEMRRRSDGSDLVVLYGNYGLGGAATQKGEVIRGASGFGGDFGHIQMNPEGPVCLCGKRGCLQLYAGLPMLLKDLNLSKQNDDEFRPKVDSLVRTAIKESSENPAPMKGMGRWLARGAAIAIQVLSPDHIVLGGIYSDLAPLFWEDYVEELQALVAPDVLKDTTTVISEMGRDAPLIGGAQAIVDAVLEDPEGLEVLVQGFGSS